jgi:proton-coupled amino acid transporter
MDSDEFSSLRLQGGDITRPIYRYAEGSDAVSGTRAKRSQSFNIPRPEPESEVLDISNIKVPGGFRRNFLRRAADDPEVPIQIPQPALDGATDSSGGQGRPKPQLFTSNFLEFLTLYGHFAGEDLEEDDEVLEPDEYFSSDAWEDRGYAGEDSEGEPGEGSTLLTPGTPGRRKRKHKERGATGNNSSFNAVLLLLKSFVGTGVLFLPRAYLNGGMLFSNLVLLGVACLSYYCFILLVNTRLKVEGSFGDIGGALYGKYMRGLILSSIVLSQIGFVSAYIVFTAENLQAFVLAVSNCRKYIDIKFMVLMQLVIFLPLSLIRDIGKLGFTALVADVFIMLGLIYLYYYDIATIVDQGGVSDIKPFNPSTWTLFIGTAIFTFEGVGLIIPIQESMRRPSKFPGVLAIVMVIITTLFISIGALSYAAYGSHTRTVVILNLPQGDKFVNAVQFLYSLAILLSTPLQLFPAIRIMENELFSRSGKYNPYIKWQKNAFRFCLVVMCALIAWGGAGDLDKFVALVGSFACVPLVYVYPPLLHLKAVAKKPWQRMADYAVCCFGVVGCAYTTALSIYLWAGSSAPKQPGYCDT